MKFLAKINRYYFKTFLIALLAIFVIGYFSVHKIISMANKQELLENEMLVIEQIKKDSILPNFYPLVEVRKINTTVNEHSNFSTIYLEDKSEPNEVMPYTEYTSIKKVNNSNYEIKLRISFIRTDELLLSLAFILLPILLLVSLSVILINKKLTKRVWSKFEKNLQSISNYDFNTNDKLQLKPTGINEFDQLNKIVASLTNKLNTDYIALKDFADNASHEMQSPLAVIKMNLETILQKELPKNISKKVYISYQYINKLQKLNKSLLLLTKIDNNQFIDFQTIDLSTLISQKLEEFFPLTKAMNLKIDSNLTDEFNIKIDPVLADVLVNNLLSNAINHNIEGGSIAISSKLNSLLIANSTTNITSNVEELFNRFKKGNINTESVGLGLSIIKKITDLHRINILLKHSNAIMTVTLSK